MKLVAGENEEHQRNRYINEVKQIDVSLNRLYEGNHNNIRFKEMLKFQKVHFPREGTILSRASEILFTWNEGRTSL